MICYFRQITHLFYTLSCCISLCDSNSTSKLFWKNCFSVRLAKNISYFLWINLLSGTMFLSAHQNIWWFVLKWSCLGHAEKTVRSHVDCAEVGTNAQYMIWHHCEDDYEHIQRPSQQSCANINDTELMLHGDIASTSLHSINVKTMLEKILC